MTDDEKLERDLAALSAVYHEAGLKAGEEVGKKPRTPERQAKVDAMLARARASVRAAREEAVADLLAEQPQQEARPIPARILAMAREAVVERLHALTQGTGDMLYNRRSSFASSTSCRRRICGAFWPTSRNNLAPTRSELLQE